MLVISTNEATPFYTDDKFEETDDSPDAAKTMEPRSHTNVHRHYKRTCSLDRRLISCCADGSRVAISIVWVLSTRERRDHAISNPDTSVIISPGTGARR